ncbi:MAG: histone deacetylase [Myxococcota bacterium]
MWIWRDRYRAHSRLGREVGLWFHPDYSAHELDEAQLIPNVQLDRSDRVLDRLTDRGLVRMADVRMPALASIEELAWVHGREYLDASVTPETLAHIFGIPAETVDVDLLVQAQRRVVGGTISAAMAVSGGELAVGVNLGGGLHHASRNQGAGFCIYNDIAVAIARVRRSGYSEPIAIVDLDFHQGDGNLDTFAEDPTVLTYSLHGAAWKERAAVANLDVQLPPRAGDREYLDKLRATLGPALEQHAPKLVFYVAGTDVLAGDTLGDFLLSPRGVLDRDIAVTQLTKKLGAGLVVTMGGGYSGGAWQATANFVRWLLTDDKRATRHPELPIRRRFRQISRGLGAGELQRIDDHELTFTDEDFQIGLGRPHRSHLVLGYYTRQGVEFALESFGFLPELRKRGFHELRIDGLDREPATMRIFGRAEKRPEELLLTELIVRKATIEAPAGLEGAATIDALMIEWLLLQNPTRTFAPGRPRLPGQNHPGLGLAGLMQEILIRVTARLRLEGLLSRPSHYHNAALAGPQYQFLDPVVEGRFRAMRRALAHLSIPEATSLVEAGDLRDKNSNVVPWEPGDQILPTSPRLKAYFESTAFQKAAAAAMEELTEAGLLAVGKSSLVGSGAPK